MNHRPSPRTALPPPVFTALVLVTTLLAACGGGGEDEATQPETLSSSTAAGVLLDDTAAPSEPVASSLADDRETASAVTITANCGLSNFAAEALSRINRYRAAGASCGSRGTFAAAPALAWDTRLITAATRHSTDMVTKRFFSHTGSDGSSPGTRITRAGYAWRTYGENIAAGQRTVQAVVDGWMKSPGHCANIMNRTYRHVGLACVKGTSANAYPTYWTMDLATPR
jgi:uncharacterized protein YkwD